MTFNFFLLIENCYTNFDYNCENISDGIHSISQIDNFTCKPTTNITRKRFSEKNNSCVYKWHSIHTRLQYMTKPCFGLEFSLKPYLTV